MTYHLIATTTLSRQNANRLGTGQGHVPQILTSGEFDDIYRKAKKLAGGRTVWAAELQMTDTPIFSTEEWTYWIVEQK